MFGLGNRQYEHFNAMGKLVDERLNVIGGQRIHEVLLSIFTKFSLLFSPITSFQRLSHVFIF